jgi:hypothetical protein
VWTCTTFLCGWEHFSAHHPAPRRGIGGSKACKKRGVGKLKELTVDRATVFKSLPACGIMAARLAVFISVAETPWMIQIVPKLTVFSFRKNTLDMSH